MSLDNAAASANLARINDQLNDAAKSAAAGNPDAKPENIFDFVIQAAVSFIEKYGTKFTGIQMKSILSTGIQKGMDAEGFANKNITADRFLGMFSNVDTTTSRAVTDGLQTASIRDFSRVEKPNIDTPNVDAPPVEKPEISALSNPVSFRELAGEPGSYGSFAFADTSAMPTSSNAPRGNGGSLDLG